MITNTAPTIGKYDDNPGLKEAIYRRIAQGKKIAKRLFKLALDNNLIMGLGVAILLRSCIEDENVWMGEDLHNEDGELFNGKGTLCGCGRRLCPFCAADLRRKSRRRTRRAVREVMRNRAAIEAAMRAKLEKIAKKCNRKKKKEIDKRLARKILDLRWRFVTLTAPKVPGIPVEKIIEVYNQAFGLMRKRNFFESWVAGGIKGVEFTVEHGAGIIGIDTSSPYHVHIHLMIYSEWLPWDELQDEWTYCITEAWRRAGHKLEINTPSGKVMTRISLIVPKVKKGQQGVISEEAAIQEVIKYVTKPDSWLKMPDKQLLECAQIKKWPRMFELFGCVRELVGEEREDEKVTSTILDTPVSKPVSGESEQEKVIVAGGIKVGEVKKKTRGPAMLDLLESMPFDVWIETIRMEIMKRRAYRKLMLASKYPFARFITLAGEEFGFVKPPS